MQAVLTWAFFLQLKVMTFLKVMSIPMVVTCEIYEFKLYHFYF